MPIPLAVTTFTQQRATNIDEDSGDELDWETVKTKIKGTPSYYSGSESVAHGSRERVDARLFLDLQPDMRNFDRLVDETTGDTWAIAWVRTRRGLGLDHTVVGVYEITGTARANKDL